MVVGNDVSHCNRSSPSFSWEAVGSIKMIVWNKEPLIFLGVFEGRAYLNASVMADYFVHNPESKCHFY